MNYRRGFFRLWIIFTVLWAGYFLWLGVSSHRNIKDTEDYIQLHRDFRDKALARGSETTAKENQEIIFQYRQFQRDDRESIEFASTYGPTVPIILLLLYPVFIFIRRGFSSDQAPTKTERAIKSDSSTSTAIEQTPASPEAVSLKSVHEVAAPPKDVAGIQEIASAKKSTAEEKPASSKVTASRTQGIGTSGAYCRACDANTTFDGKYCSVCGTAKELSKHIDSTRRNEARDKGTNGEGKLNFGKAVQVCLIHKYATFVGRASRSELWWFFLFQTLLLLIASAIHPLLYIPALFGIFIPTLAVSVRRLHDLGMPGYWAYLWFLPVIGPFYLLIRFMGTGTGYVNEYGAPPNGN